MPKTLFVLTLALAIIGFLVYSVVEYRKSGIERSGLVTCVENECFWSTHMHAYAPIEICGQKYLLPKFRGPLSGNHTHADENLLHWHDRVPYDREKKSFIEAEPFRMDKTFQDLGLPISQDRLLGKQDGDACGAGSGSWKALVNGKGDPNWRAYPWQNGDIVYFAFDSRTTAETEEGYRRNPFKFPKVTPE